MINYKGSETHEVHTSNPSDPVATIVIKRERLIKETDIIKKSLECMPCEYRQGVWDNIQFYTAFPTNADRTTYGRYKSKYIYTVAKKFGYIGDNE